VELAPGVPHVDIAGRDGLAAGGSEALDGLFDAAHAGAGLLLLVAHLLELGAQHVHVVDGAAGCCGAGARLAVLLQMRQLLFEGAHRRLPQFGLGFEGALERRERRAHGLDLERRALLGDAGLGLRGGEVMLVGGDAHAGEVASTEERREQARETTDHGPRVREARPRARKKGSVTVRAGRGERGQRRARRKGSAPGEENVVSAG
jgi:hypothetical protein